jgi:hypothetical protein
MAALARVPVEAATSKAHLEPGGFEVSHGMKSNFGKAGAPIQESFFS